VTEKNKHENMHEELSRAATSLNAADLLHRNGFLNEAVSRLYYFLLYKVRALLLSEGLEPRSHEGVLRLFSLHFIKKGRFPPESAHLFSKLMKYREEADYNPSYSFQDQDYPRLKDKAKALADRIDEYLANLGGN
jgi:hypothetical protein